MKLSFSRLVHAFLLVMSLWPGMYSAFAERVRDTSGNYMSRDGLWRKVGNDINGIANTDKIGKSVAISKGGSTVATNYTPTSKWLQFKPTNATLIFHITYILIIIYIICTV